MDAGGTFGRQTGQASEGRSIMLVSTRETALTVALALALAGCTVKKQEAPPVSGPSELGTSISLAANPDTLPQDGLSQSQIVVQARDGSGQPVRNLPLAAEIAVNGVVQDFGRLSARNLATGSDGRASLTYTAPAQVDSVDRRTTVSIRVVPIGSDAGTQVARSVDIRLVPPGIIVPPGPGVPNFTISPNPATQLQSVQFDASDPQLNGVLISYQWDFGDGSSGSGRLVQHQYRNSGVFTVTLTVADSTGAASSLAKQVTVNPGAAPNASFTYSPSNPGIGTEIFFNASASTAAAGRSIVSYDWEFGTGRTASGVVVSKRYDTPGSYTVTLVVTDDAGVQGTTSTTVTVSASSPSGLTADFSYSPASPAPGTMVFFNAETSTSADPIIDYVWDFGDGTRLNGPSATISHAFASAGDYTVTLTIKDNKGRTATRARAINVN